MGRDSLEALLAQAAPARVRSTHEKAVFSAKTLKWIPVARHIEGLIACANVKKSR
jgi:hypothetical protein